MRPHVSAAVRLVSLLAVFVLAAVALVETRAVAAAPIAAPATPKGLPAAIEPLATYVEQTACNPTTKPGTARLAQLLVHTYPDTTFATVYACGTDGVRSEHYDGRAIDWMASVANPHQHAEATALIGWLLATDAQGNRFAMARRLGVMYLIYDNRMWGAWDGKWEQYNGCAALTSHAYDNSCHRTHVHISLGWNGAMGRTTFWTQRVAATDYGPCRPADLNWATYTGHRRLTPCPDLPLVTAAKGASAVKQALVHYSGSAVRHSWLGGPAVAAVQEALHLPATGVFGMSTRAKVLAFQAHRRIAATGVMTAATWRALLKVTH